MSLLISVVSVALFSVLCVFVSAFSSFVSLYRSPVSLCSIVLPDQLLFCYHFWCSRRSCILFRFSIIFGNFGVLVCLFLFLAFPFYLQSFCLSHVLASLCYSTGPVDHTQKRNTSPPNIDTRAENNTATVLHTRAVQSAAKRNGSLGPSSENSVNVAVLCPRSENAVNVLVVFAWAPQTQ